MKLFRPSFLCICLILTGCDFQAASGKIVGLSEPDSQAIGSACRQSQRNLESCFERNPHAKAGFIHQGWLEMDSYIRENGGQEFKVTQEKERDSGESPAQSTAPVSTSPTGEGGQPIGLDSPVVSPIRQSRWAPRSANAASDEGLVTQ